MTRSLTLSFLLSGALLLASCGAEPDQKGAAGGQKARAANVFVEPLQNHDFKSRIEASGNPDTPKEQVNLTSELG